MIIRAVDANNDWLFGASLQNYLTYEAALEQNVVSTVLSWVGDVYWANNFGVDYYNLLGVGQQQNLAQSIKQIILGCWGVVGIPIYTSVYSGATRLESISATMVTIFSPQAPLIIPIPTPQG